LCGWPTQIGGFEKNLKALHQKKLVRDDWKATLDQMWAERHSFHFLCPAVESDKQRLEALAAQALKLANDLHREFFGLSVRDGSVFLDHPEYWPTK